MLSVRSLNQAKGPETQLREFCWHDLNLRSAVAKTFLQMRHHRLQCLYRLIDQDAIGRYRFSKKPLVNLNACFKLAALLATLLAYFNALLSPFLSPFLPPFMPPFLDVAVGAALGIELGAALGAGLGAGLGAALGAGLGAALGA